MGGLEGAHRKFQGQSPQRGPYYNARPLIFNRHRIRIALWTVAGRNGRADTTQLLRLSLAPEFSVLSLERSGNRRFSKAKMGHALSFRELTEMIAEADTDGDGRISFAEFTAAVTSASVDYLKASLM